MSKTFVVYRLLGKIDSGRFFLIWRSRRAVHLPFTIRPNRFGCRGASYRSYAAGKRRLVASLNWTYVGAVDGPWTMSAGYNTAVRVVRPHRVSETACVYVYVMMTRRWHNLAQIDHFTSSTLHHCSDCNPVCSAFIPDTAVAGNTQTYIKR